MTATPTTATPMAEPDTLTWVAVCGLDALQRERGVAALIGAQQIALFRTFDDVLHAVGNRDPYTGTYVLSRGIVGSRGDRPTIASPLHKQVYDLTTGQCLDDPSLVVPVYPVRLREETVEVAT